MSRALPQAVVTRRRRRGNRGAERSTIPALNNARRAASFGVRGLGKHTSRIIASRDGAVSSTSTSFRLLYRPSNEEQPVRVYELLLASTATRRIRCRDDRTFNVQLLSRYSSGGIPRAITVASLNETDKYMIVLTTAAMIKLLSTRGSR